MDGMRPVSKIERTVAPIEVVSPYQPSGDQPTAIAELAKRIEAGEKDVVLLGATGTGKTVTLQVLAEGFSAAGVPVFAADIKGDLSGIAVKGTPSPKLVARAEEIGLQRYGNTSFPTAFWDIFGVDGHPVRATVQEMGPLLLSRLTELTEPQEGVLNIAFRWAQDEREAGDERMSILDLKDLRSVIDEMGKRAASLRSARLRSGDRPRSRRPGR